jgi:hypothetical protein
MDFRLVPFFKVIAASLVVVWKRKKFDGKIQELVTSYFEDPVIPNIVRYLKDAETSSA